MKQRYNKKSYRGRSYSNYYQATANAWDLNTLERYDRVRKPRTEDIKKTKKKVKFKRKVKSVYKNVGETQHKVSPLTIASICLVFVYAIGLVLSFAFISNKQIQISNLNKELDKLKNQNIITEADISKNIDIKKIEEIAINKLKMGKPKPHQIKHIEVTKQGYSKKTDLPTETISSKTIFGEIYELIFSKG